LHRPIPHLPQKCGSLTALSQMALCCATWSPEMSLSAQGEQSPLCIYHIRGRTSKGHGLQPEHMHFIHWEVFWPSFLKTLRPSGQILHGHLHLRIRRLDWLGWLEWVVVSPSVLDLAVLGPAVLAVLVQLCWLGPANSVSATSGIGSSLIERSSATRLANSVSSTSGVGSSSSERSRNSNNKLQIAISSSASLRT
jgi:hypothetical protein